LQQASTAGDQDPEHHYITHELHAKLELDLEYLRRRSLRYDLTIVLHTVLLVIGLGKRIPAPSPSADPPAIVAAVRAPSQSGDDMPPPRVRRDSVTREAAVAEHGRPRPRSS
jgi:hypothetical protein